MKINTISTISVRIRFVYTLGKSHCDKGRGYNNCLIAKLLNIFANVEKKRKERRELGSHASNKVGMEAYEVVSSNRDVGKVEKITETYNNKNKFNI